MSNPAIVLLTDPSRCGLGDVHHLVQALLEIQQMGEHATPQALCDHPAAAQEFMTAYADAYPKLVLQSQEIPTPDHLQALITNGQVGPLAQPQDVHALAESWRPEQNGLNPFPLVVLTLGNPQALLDALQQSQLIKENISLIDIGPEGTSDIVPVSIAEAVATRGRGTDPALEETHSSTSRAELDEVGGAATPDSTDFVSRDDQISLDTVEPAEPAAAPAGNQQAYYGDTGPQPDQAAQSEPAAAEQEAEPARPQEAAETKPATEQTESPAQVPGSEPASAATADAVPDETVPDTVDAAPTETPPGDTVPDDKASDEADNKTPDDGPEDEHADGGKQTKQPAEKDTDEGEDATPLAASDAGDEQDDDVYYAPVGTLTDSADVLYAAADDVEAPGTLWELAAAMSDDGILDTELSSEILALAQDVRDADWSALKSYAPSHGPAGDEAFYGAADPQTDDDAPDVDLSRPAHDSDL